jgi:hypothetical protein
MLRILVKNSNQSSTVQLELNQCTPDSSVRLELGNRLINPVCTDHLQTSVIYDEERQMCIIRNPAPFEPKVDNEKVAPNTVAGITFGTNANRLAVSDYSLAVLKEIMDASNNPGVIITSTLRTAEDQARAMFQNIKSKGLAFNYKLYGSTGDKVIKVAEVAMKAGKSDAEVMKLMTIEVNRIGPGKVSRHAGDPEKLNVIDISPRSIVNKKDFVREVKRRGFHLLEPPKDPAFHIEIPQPKLDVLP